MEIILSGRNFDISDDLKAYTEAKISKLAEVYAKLTTARIVMETERNWHLAEARVNGKGIELDASSRSRDMYISIDDTCDKIEKQLHRHLGKIQGHRQNQRFEPVPPATVEESDEEML
jgi:putative sigma-54 modulation protein